MLKRFGTITDTSSRIPTIPHCPYTEIAHIYDNIMTHVDYPAWADYLVSIFKHFKVVVRDILEIACGTASITIELHKRGYCMTCMDISPLMLRIARKKLKRLGMPFNLFAGNMTALPLACQFDAVLCIYDSINYLMAPEDFRRAVNEAASVTRHGGLFILDICTVKNSEMFFSEKVIVEDFGNVKYTRNCRFDKQKRIQESHFTIYTRGENMRQESHFQKIYFLDEITRMITGTSFKEIGRFEDMTFIDGSENSERVHFVLQKE